MESRDTARALYAGSTDPYLLNLNDHLAEFHGVPSLKEYVPFFIEMVDINGRPVGIPFPPEQRYTERSRIILGVKLMINPNTMSMNMSKTINRTQSMVGFIEEHWGEELDTMTLQGSTAAFVLGANSIRDIGRKGIEQAVEKDKVRADFYSYLDIPEYSVTSADNRGILDSEPGLTTRYRSNSASYKELKRIVQIFATNGCVFDEKGFVANRNFIRLTYGQGSYMGYLESLDIVEDSAMPFRFNYTITYKVEKTIYKFNTRPAIKK